MQKLSRLGSRMKDPEWRRYAGLVAVGKFVGMALVLLVILYGPTVFSKVTAMLSGQTAYGQTMPTEAATMPAGMVMGATTEAAVVNPATTQPVMASDLTDSAKNPVINPLNTVWVLVAAFLVFGMQVGFTMLEAGFCRSRETVNVLVECVFDTCLCGVLFWAWGYAFMFGAGNGFIGWHDPNDATRPWFFLQNIDATTLYGSYGIPILAHWLFQFAFADCASTICSGAMIGRTGFWGDILYSVAVSGFIYPIIGHWAWGPDGFLAMMGGKGMFLESLGMNFHDFAGSTVVHAIGGTIALAGAIVLGPRLGRKFKRDGGGPMTPHDLTIAVCGGLLLWFGWYGFNPGSTLSAMDFAGIGRVAANTTLAACAGGLIAEFIVYFRTKKWDPGAITNGFLAGLVAITCPCYWVSPLGALILGAVAGVIVILGTDLLEHLRIDDPIGAVPVHMMNGIWGTISLGLFASGEYQAAGSSPTGVPSVVAYSDSALTGLFYGGGSKVLIAQLVGNATIVISTFVVAFIVFKVLDLAGILRISKHGEAEGMDLHEHGISAYPEYQILTSALPSGLPPDGGYQPDSSRVK
ncbi:MAG: ammonium transporter [Phycisphaerae bacterium]